MDFQYMDAYKNFRSMDELISYMNENYSDKWDVQYSTPSDYVDSLAAQNINFTTKQDDLFPYPDQPSSYWTGYFSSRANAKSQVRWGSANLHASNQLYTKAVLDQNVDSQTVDTILEAKEKMLDEMGIYQHHDAVSGTARQDVADDYTTRLVSGLEVNNKAYAQAADI